MAGDVNWMDVQWCAVIVPEDSLDVIRRSPRHFAPVRDEDIAAGNAVSMSISSRPTHVRDRSPTQGSGDGDASVTQTTDAHDPASPHGLRSRSSSVTGSPAPRATLPQAVNATAQEVLQLRDLGGVLTDEKTHKKSAFWVRMAGQPSGHGLLSDPRLPTLKPDREERAQANATARANGLVPHGWNLRKEVNPRSKRGKERLVAERLHVSLDQAKVPRTSTTLPVRRNVLYEASANGRAPGDKMPQEVASVVASIRAPNVDPKTKPVDAKLGDFANARRIGEVLTFELGNTYLMHVPPGIGKHPVVAVTGHGLEATNLDVPLEPNIVYTYFGPSTRPIVGTPVRDIEEDRAYALHANIDGEDVVVPVADKARDASRMELAGTSKPLHMPEMRLTKFGSLHDGDDYEESGYSREGYIRDQESARELAFLAHDQNMVVVTIRKGQTGSPNDLLTQMKAIGMTPSEIRIHACRAEALAKPDPQNPEQSLLESGADRPNYYTDDNARSRKT